MPSIDYDKLEWKRQAVCGNCKAIGFVTVYDITREGDKFYIECPFCDTKKYVTSSSEEELIRRDLENI